MKLMMRKKLLFLTVAFLCCDICVGTSQPESHTSVSSSTKTSRTTVTTNHTVTERNTPPTAVTHTTTPNESVAIHTVTEGNTPPTAVRHTTTPKENVAIHTATEGNTPPTAVTRTTTPNESVAIHTATEGNTPPTAVTHTTTPNESVAIHTVTEGNTPPTAVRHTTTPKENVAIHTATEGNTPPTAVTRTTTPNESVAIHTATEGNTPPTAVTRTTTPNESVAIHTVTEGNTPPTAVRHTTTPKENVAIHTATEGNTPPTAVTRTTTPNESVAIHTATEGNTPPTAVRHTTTNESVAIHTATEGNTPPTAVTRTTTSNESVAIHTATEGNTPPTAVTRTTTPNESVAIHTATEGNTPPTAVTHTVTSNERNTITSPTDGAATSATTETDADSSTDATISTVTDNTQSTAGAPTTTTLAEIIPVADTTPSSEENVLWPDYKKYSSRGNDKHRYVLDIPFPYFGTDTSVINVYDNGYVSFNEELKLPEAPQLTDWTFYPNLFAVYWANIEYPQNNESYFYHYKDATRLKKNVTHETSLIKYVKRVVKVTDFQPLYVIALTWVNAMYRPANQYPNDKATFQLILATDSEASYAIKSYQKVWNNTEVANKPHYTAAYTLANSSRSNTFTAIGDSDPEIIPLGSKNSSKTSYECVEQTHSVKTILGDSIRKLPPCPCQRVQAANDPRFHELNSCYQRNYAGNDKLKQRCCYNVYGLLITNSKEAQVPKTDDGKLENAADKCCSGNKLCDWFYKQIPSSNCSDYTPPYIAVGFGDPHIVTSDNNRFTFNSLGDFVLFKSVAKNVEVQVRTSLSENKKTTYFSAYAVKIENKTNQLHINGTYLFLDNEQVAENEYESESSGLIIKIQVTNETLYHTIIADGFIPDSVGLMGSLDGNPANDFKFRDGTPERTGHELSGVFINEFASSWAVNGTMTIIIPVSHQSNNNLTSPENTAELVKKMFSENETTFLHQAEDICDENVFCLQDFYFNHNDDSAKGILEFDRHITLQKELSSIAPPEFANTDEVINITRTSEPFYYLNLTVVNNSHVFFNFSHTFGNIPAIEISSNTFIWNVESGLDHLRKLSYPQSLIFYVTDVNTNKIAAYAPTINLCLCDKVDQCQAAQGTTKGAGNVNSNPCVCSGNKGGKFCERIVDLCTNCFNESNCNNNTDNYCSACPDGYEGNGKTCYDRDECANNKNGCEYGCENTPGSSKCYCQNGYHPNGKACTEIDECEKDYNICNDVYKFCTNLPGTYKCSCLPGMVGDEHCIRAPFIYIVKIPLEMIADKESFPHLLSNETREFKYAGQAVVNHTTEELALKGYSGSTYVDILYFTDFNKVSYTDTRAVSNETEKYKLTAVTIVYSSQLNDQLPKDIVRALENINFPPCDESCIFRIIRTSDPVTFDVDADLCGIKIINKCDNLTTKCHSDQHTIHCQCNKGYRTSDLSIYSCDDINECLTFNCSDKTPCINTAGAYRCVCEEGKVWFNSLCVGDKCFEKPCKNGGTCHVAGDNEAFICSCTYGWTGPDCSDEDTDARRWKIAVISVSAILGFCCVALLIIVIVVCTKHRRNAKKASSSSNDHAEFKPLPRSRVSQKSEMEEKNSVNHVYTQLQADSTSDKISSFYSPVSEGRNDSNRIVYNNAAFESDVVAHL